uniref:VPS9 domain-containing protein n=2 Tax=Kalanchoe fedtschenkoi TaxID=63787 RepID=A0A7N0VBR2_KALFE
MENAEAFEASTAPLSLHDFFERMRQPAAAEFVKAIKSFVVSFSNKAPNHERDSAAVQDFLSNMERAFREHPLWAGCSVEELDCAGEGLEKYVMTKLFTHVFASLPDDLEVDRQLSDKMALLQQFIRPENLDIKPNFRNEASWLIAQKELQKINMYKSPRDKLACILSCCKVINNILLHASMSSDENPPGADEFLPVLIYVTIKANPPQLHSNLLYIQRYRHHPRLVAEYAYYFTNMLSVESFITNINAKALSMDETEFEMNMESARALNLGLSADTSDMSDQNEQNLENTSNKEAVEIKQGFSNFKTDHVTRPPPSVSKSGKIELRHTKAESSIRKIPSMSDLENKGAFMLLNENRLSRVFQEYPYLFSQVGDLTLDDVESLLNNYKQLVFKYVSLAKGKGSEPLPPPFISMSNSQSQRATPADAERESIEEPVAEKTNNRNEANSWTDEGSIEVSQVPELNSPDYKMPEVSSAQVEADHDHDNS